MTQLIKKTITYIFPIFNESENIDLLYKTINELVAIHADKYNFELVYVNDGSRDDSLIKLYDLQSKDSRIVIINFTRNFGHQIAITAGLDNAKGDAVIIMDSDMQDPPEISIEMIRKWESGFDVVYAKRCSRQDSFFKRLTAYIFYWSLHKLSDINIPRNTGDFRLLDRRVVDVLNQFREHNRFLRGMSCYVGFNQIAVQFNRNSRYAGTTNYTFSKMLGLAVDGILGFSWVPLKLISNLGYFFSILSFFGVLYALIVKIFYPSVAISGWTFTVIAIFMTGGIQMIMLGVLGSYIGRIYTETQNRPLYIVESIRRIKNE